MIHLAMILALQLGADPMDEAFQPHTFTFTGGEYDKEPFEYRLMKPATIEPGKKYPVVLFLHGAGERGSDNRKQLAYLPERLAKPEMRKKYPAFVIAPQCRSGRRWVEVDWSAKESTPLAEQPGTQMQVAIGILEHVIKNFPVDKQRIYLTGLSMGGYGSWELAQRRPELFAAVAPICGGGDERQAKRLADVPVYAYHGDADGAVPVARTRTMIAAIKEAGGKPKYKELPGVGHNSWNAAYNDADGVVPWMFQQVKKR